MDQHDLEVRYKSDQHQENARQVQHLEEERKQRGNADRQRENLREYLEYDNTTQAFQGVERLKNGKELLKTGGVSLAAMKSATERIYHKDKKDYVARTTAGKQALSQQYREDTLEELSKQKAAAAYEYQELLKNCRVFDNEVRETVEETLAQHPELLSGYSNGNLPARKEALARLLTAFLPEREFHFNPPSGDQKALVKKYLKDFKSNPENAIRNMQQSLRGERLHRDFLDASTGMNNLRMLYTDMRKREALAVVFPHIEANAAERFEVRKMAESVEKRKTMIKDLLLMNGLAFDWSLDLEFNREWVNTKTLQNRTKAEKRAIREAQMRSSYEIPENALRNQSPDSEAALLEYLEAYRAVRKTEQEVNRYYKDQITAGITESGGLYRPQEIHKNYRSVMAFVQDNNRSIWFREDTSPCRIPLTEKDAAEQSITVHSEKYHAYHYLREHILSAVSDANYTRYRRERLKKMKPSGSLPEKVLEKNRQKEEGRLRLLENRISDFQALMRLMEQVRFDPKKIQDDRLKRLYQKEILPEAESLRRKEAMEEYSAKCTKKITDAEKNFKEDKALLINNDHAAGNDDLSIPKDVVDKFEKKEKSLYSARFFLANKERYDEQLQQHGEQWEKEKKRKEAEKLGREALHLPPLEQEDLTREEALEKKIESSSPRTTIDASVEKSREELFVTPRSNWQYKTPEEKKEYYFKLRGLEVPKEEKPDENGFYQEDAWNLTKEEEELIVRFFDGDTYRRLQEAFDPEGILVLPENAPLFSGDKNVPSYDKLQLLFDRKAEKLKYQKDRVYLPEVQEYYNDYHARREGGMDYHGTLTGRVKFNVERVIKKHKEILARKEEENQREKDRQERRKLNEPIQKKKIKDHRNAISEFASRMGSLITRYEKTGKKDMEETDRTLITAEDLLQAEEMAKQQEEYLKGNAEFMLPYLQSEVRENLEKITELKEKLWSAFDRQYEVVSKEASEEFGRLDAMMKDGTSLDMADAIVTKLEGRLGSLLFGEKKHERMNRETEEGLKELKRKAGLRRVTIQYEKRDGRQVMMQEIRNLYANLEKEPEKKQAEEDRIIGVTKEARTLRRVSLLAMRCAAYLDFDSKKTEKSYDRNLFCRKKDLTYVKKLMKELKKNYLTALEDKVLGVGYKEAANRANEIMLMRSKGQEVDPALLEPELRYRIKYAGGYLILSEVDKKKETREQEEKGFKAETRMNLLKERIFQNTYCGTESEEEEEKILAGLREKMSLLQEMKAQQEEKLRKEMEQEEERKRKEIEEKQREEQRKQNNAAAKEFLDQKEVRFLVSKTEDFLKNEKSMLSALEEESRAFLKETEASVQECRELDEKIRETMEKWIKVNRIETGEVQGAKYKAGDPEVQDALATLSKRLTALRKRREQLWNDAGDKLQNGLKRQRRQIVENRNMLKDTLFLILEKKPEFFAEDPEQRMETDNQTVQMLQNTKVILENDKLETILEQKNRKEEETAFNFLLESKGAYLIELSGDYLKEVKNGNLLLGEKIWDQYESFQRTLRSCSSRMTEEQRKKKTEAFEEGMQKNLLAIQLEVMNHLRRISDQDMEERIGRLGDQPTVDKAFLGEIRKITEYRRKDLVKIYAECSRSVVGGEEAFATYREFVSRNEESAAMKALKEKIEAPLLLYAKNSTEKASLALQEAKELRGEEKEEKLKELDDILSEMEAAEDDLLAIKEVLGRMESQTLLQRTSETVSRYLRAEEKKKNRAKRPAEMDENDILEMLYDLEAQDEYDEADLKDLELIRKTYDTVSRKLKKDKSVEPDDLKQVTEYGERLKSVLSKANQVVGAGKLQDKYRVIREEVALAVSKTGTLDDRDLKMIQSLKNSISSYGRDKTYQSLLTSGLTTIQNITEAMERDKKRLEKRLRLHNTEKTLRTEFQEMEKERAKNTPKKETDAAKVLRLDEEIARYETFLDSEDCLTLRAEKIGSVTNEVKAAIKGMKTEAAVSRGRLLDRRFEEICKKTDKVIQKKGALSMENMTLLVESLGDLSYLSAGETFRKLEEALPEESGRRQKEWNSYIASVNQRISAA